MRVPIAILAATAAILAVAGCGASSDRTPAACLDGANAYIDALQGAPGKVRLGGEIPIGDCLPENQKSGDLATVGATLVTVATRLNAEARTNPGSSANLQLGYLLGATRDRAERTGGIHDELLRRLAAAARYSPRGHPLPLRFLSTFRLGEDAGYTSG